MAKKQRIPKDITVLDLVAFAESIGCIVGIRFVEKNAQQNVQRTAATPRKSKSKSKAGKAVKAAAR